MKKTKTDGNYPQRLNLIFHGLMAFLDASDDYYEVLIPNPPDPAGVGKAACHEAVYGDPRGYDRPDANLFKFDTGEGPGPVTYRIEGICPPVADDIGKPAKANALILAKSGLDVNYTNVQNIIRVPKPNIIRHYRGGETRGAQLVGPDIADTTEGADDPVVDAATQALFTPPTLIHEVTVFSYFCFNTPTLVGPGTPFSINYYPPAFWNLCIYSQPKDSSCQDTDSDLFNAMFYLTGIKKPPSVNLFSVESYEDGAPASIAANVGIDPSELKSLSEVHTPETPTLGGCVSGFVCGDGNSS